MPPVCEGIGLCVCVGGGGGGGLHLFCIKTGVKTSLPSLKRKRDSSYPNLSLSTPSFARRINIGERGSYIGIGCIGRAGDAENNSNACIQLWVFKCI